MSEQKLRKIFFGSAVEICFFEDQEGNLHLVKTRAVKSFETFINALLGIASIGDDSGDKPALTGLSPEQLNSFPTAPRGAPDLGQSPHVQAGKAGQPEPVPESSKFAPGQMSFEEFTPEDLEEDVSEAIGAQVQPGQVQPGQVQPGQVQPGQVQPGQVQPGQVQPGAVDMASLQNQPTPALFEPQAAVAESGRKLPDLGFQPEVEQYDATDPDGPVPTEGAYHPQDIPSVADAMVDVVVDDDEVITSSVVSVNQPKVSVADLASTDVADDAAGATEVVSQPVASGPPAIDPPVLPGSAPVQQVSHPVPVSPGEVPVHSVMQPSEKQQAVESVYDVTSSTANPQPQPQPEPVATEQAPQVGDRQSEDLKFIAELVELVDRHRSSLAGQSLEKANAAVVNLQKLTPPQKVSKLKQIWSKQMDAEIFNQLPAEMVDRALTATIYKIYYDDVMK